MDIFSAGRRHRSHKHAREPRRRTLGGDAAAHNTAHAMPRRGPVVPKLDLSRLGKFQVGNEKEEKSKSEYSYKVRPTCLPL